MGEEDIYVLIKEKNEEGLSLLLDKYGGLLAYIAKNRGIFNEEDLSECVSDILFTIWQRIAKFDQAKSSFKTWVIMVARGCAVDYLRKAGKHQKTISIDGLGELSADSHELDKMGYDGLIMLLQELPPPDNNIFYRRFVLGESVKEIASLLDLTVDNVYKRLNRGKERLKDLLNREGY